MRVAVYRNLHKKCWSVTSKGLVILHCQQYLLEDCEFRVGEKSRQRVIREKRKNVHARVYGTKKVMGKAISKLSCVRVTYNPYEAGHFYEIATKKPVHTAKYAYFDGHDLYVVKEDACI